MTRILVIEDDDGLRANVVDLLGAEGFEVRAAPDGTTALSLIQAQPPDLILSDVSMPGLDGYGVLAAVRKNPATATIPFIFLSGNADRADVRAGMNLGANDYVTKPFARDDLLEAVRARLRVQEGSVARVQIVAAVAQPSAARSDAGRAATMKVPGEGPASSQQGDAPFRPGDVLAGKYRVERVLGRGGMGIVVLGVHLQLRERVAIKLMLPEASASAEAHARFLREARAATRIKSQHVARVLDFGVLENGAPMMVMEYLEGRDLAAVLEQDGPLDVGAAVEYVLQACEGVAAAHACGIVHRDLKPSNLFLTHDPDGKAVVRVLDFGISKISATDDDTVNAAKITNTNAVLGSPQYMSAEQLRGEEVDERTDVWSLAVIVHELVTGKLPFARSTVADMIGAILHQPPRRLTDDLPGGPPALEEALLRGLAKSRDERWPDVATFAERLARCIPTPAARASLASVRSILRSSGRPAAAPPSSVASRPSDDAVPTASITQPRPPERPRRGGVVAGAIAVVLLGSAGVAVLALRSRSETPAPPASRSAEDSPASPSVPAASTSAATVPTPLVVPVAEPSAAVPSASARPRASAAAAPPPVRTEKPKRPKANVLDERE